MVFGLHLIHTFGCLYASRIFAALRQVAGSPLALLGYALLLASWTYVALARHRLNRVASIISKIPEAQGAQILERAYSTFPKSGLSAEQWLRSQRQGLIFFGLLAALIAAAVLVGIALVEESRRNDVVTKPVDWQMSLYLGAIAAFEEDKKLWDIECGEETASPGSLQLPHDKVVILAGSIKLVVDNVFRTHRGLVYPVGFSTTWDRSVHVVYDGLDVETQRAGLSTTKFTRDRVFQVAIHTPQNLGQHYLVFLTGAALARCSSVVCFSS
jgi:hypothetical protein